MDCPDARLRQYLVEDLGLGPTPENIAKFLKEMQNRAGYEFWGVPRTAGETLLDMIQLNCFTDSDRRRILGSFLPENCSWLKTAVLYTTALERGWIEPSSAMVNGLLSFDEAQDPESNLHEAFRAVNAFLTRLHCPPSAEQLAYAIECAKDEDSDWVYGCRGFVLLLLYRGAPADDPAVGEAVKAGEGRARYGDFANDVLEVKCWKRWGERKMIGNLPPELVEKVMLETWEHWCKLGDRSDGSQSDDSM